ncbi:DUF2231 domain-containing protein [candidate division KSB1 bacterium]
MLNFKINLTKKLRINLHIHPIVAHFPNAMFPATSLLIIFFLFYGFQCLENAAYYCLIFGALGSPVGLVSGIFDWKTDYKGARVPLFLEKRRLSIIMVIISIALAIIRTAVPDIIETDSPIKWIYVLGILSLTPISGRLGYLGGKLVFK